MISLEDEVQKKMDKDRKTKSTKSRRETAVQGTNDSSIVSKCSMASQGYFDDPYLQAFVSKVTRRAPLIHRGYYIRAKTIDHILRRFLDSNDGDKQIISLGAGFDSAYFRLTSQNLIESTVFFEVDFPEVVKRKRALIEANNDLLSMIGENCMNSAKKNPLIELCSKSYKLIGADLSQINTMEAALKLCDIDFDRPTLLLSECVLTYMTRRTASGVIRWAGETFSNAVFVLYEQINPNDAFGLFMQNHFNTVGSPLKSINYFPTIQSQKERFIKLGWSQVEAMDMNEFYNSLVTPEEHDRVERLEPFDEHEEWNLKCAHYMVLLAYHGSCDMILKTLVPKSDSPQKSIKEFSDRIQVSFTEGNQPFRRFGHGSCELGTGHLICVGGFGEQAGKHMRVTDIVVVDTVTMETTVLNPNVDNKKIEVSRMQATVSCLKDERILLIGGRMSPMRLCTQMVAMEINCEKFKSSENLENMNCGNEGKKCMNCGCVSNSISVNGDTHVNGRQESNAKFSEDANKMENSVKELCMNCTRMNISCNDSNSYSVDVVRNGDNKSDTVCINVMSESDNRQESVTVGDNGSTNESSPQSVKTTPQDSKVMCSVIEQYGDIPSPRWRHSTVMYNDKGTEMLYLFGGRSQTVFALDDCYRFTPANQTWQKIEMSGECPSATQSHTASVWNNMMVIAGGLNVNLQPLSTVYLFNMDTLTWRQLNCDIHPRYAHSAHILDDILILIGGVSFSHKPPGVAMVHLPSGISAEFTLPAVDKSQLVMLHRHTGVVHDDSNILLLGGGGNCFSFGTHLNPSPIMINIGEALKEMKALCAGN